MVSNKDVIVLICCLIEIVFSMIARITELIDILLSIILTEIILIGTYG